MVEDAVTEAKATFSFICLLRKLVLKCQRPNFDERDTNVSSRSPTSCSSDDLHSSFSFLPAATTRRTTTILRVTSISSIGNQSTVG